MTMARMEIQIHAFHSPKRKVEICGCGTVHAHEPVLDQKMMAVVVVVRRNECRRQNTNAKNYYDGVCPSPISIGAMDIRNLLAHFRVRFILFNCFYVSDFSNSNVALTVLLFGCDGKE